jgi:hypothetical protein
MITQATYLLPIKSDRAPTSELTDYLRRVGTWCPVVVVDSSPPSIFDVNHTAWASSVTHVAPDPAIDCANGKVRNVLSGMRLVETELAVIADDDVRYDLDELARLVDELATADLVVPQNYFEPAPWHARWDTARTLLNRVSGGDFPGTLGVRTALLRKGYDGDVLFENLEMMRTVAARGGSCRRLDDLYVRRLPPTARHFIGQRVRQAYDELARPRRLLAWMLALPAALFAVRRSPSALPVAAASLIVAAEAGRRRQGGAAYFPASASALAPAWVIERSLCVWFALIVRLRGGVSYGGGRIVRAANSPRAIAGTERMALS